MSRHSNLPPELLLFVFQEHLPRCFPVSTAGRVELSGAYARLALVSRQFYSIASELLYKSPTLTSDRSASLLHRTLSSHPSLAQLPITLELSSPSPSHWISLLSRIGFSLRSLHLLVCRPPRLVPDRTARQAQHAALSRLGEALPHLKRLHITGHALGHLAFAGGLPESLQAMCLEGTEADVLRWRVALHPQWRGIRFRWVAGTSKDALAEEALEQVAAMVDSLEEVDRSGKVLKSWRRNEEAAEAKCVQVRPGLQAVDWEEF